ncbi:hypothetical protein M8J77_020387 [Diaphorina citri]|nr:hypothetical protein M8J77_020387 [Diaphorina citri]
MKKKKKKKEEKEEEKKKEEEEKKEEEKKKEEEENKLPMSLFPNGSHWIILVCWVLGGVVGFLPLMGWHAPPTSPQLCLFTKVMDYNYLVFLYFATIVFPALLLAAFYAHIYTVVLNQFKQMLIINGTTENNSMLRVLGAARKREVKATQNLSIIVLFFIICWMPLYTINFVEAYCTTCKVPLPLLNSCIILSHLNSALNPLLYAYHLKDFRLALKYVVCGKKVNSLKRLDSNNTSIDHHNKIIENKRYSTRSYQNHAISHHGNRYNSCYCPARMNAHSKMQLESINMQKFNETMSKEERKVAKEERKLSKEERKMFNERETMSKEERKMSKEERKNSKEERKVSKEERRLSKEEKLERKMSSPYKYQKFDEEEEEDNASEEDEEEEEEVYNTSYDTADPMIDAIVIEGRKRSATFDKNKVNIESFELTRLSDELTESYACTENSNESTDATNAEKIDERRVGEVLSRDIVTLQRRYSAGNGVVFDKQFRLKDNDIETSHEEFQLRDIRRLDQKELFHLKEIAGLGDNMETCHLKDIVSPKQNNKFELKDIISPEQNNKFELKNIERLENPKEPFHLQDIVSPEHSDKFELKSSARVDHNMEHYQLEDFPRLDRNNTEIAILGTINNELVKRENYYTYMKPNMNKDQNQSHMESKQNRRISKAIDSGAGDVFKYAEIVSEENTTIKQPDENRSESHLNILAHRKEYELADVFGNREEIKTINPRLVSQRKDSKTNDENQERWEIKRLEDSNKVHQCNPFPMDQSSVQRSSKSSHIQAPEVVSIESNAKQVCSNLNEKVTSKNSINPQASFDISFPKYRRHSAPQTETICPTEKIDFGNPQTKAGITTDFNNFPIKTGVRTNFNNPQIKTGIKTDCSNLPIKTGPTIKAQEDLPTIKTTIEDHLPKADLLTTDVQTQNVIYDEPPFEEIVSIDLYRLKSSGTEETLISQTDVVEDFNDLPSNTERDTKNRIGEGIERYCERLSDLESTPNGINEKIGTYCGHVNKLEKRYDKENDLESDNCGESNNLKRRNVLEGDNCGSSNNLKGKNDLEKDDCERLNELKRGYSKENDLGKDNPAFTNDVEVDPELHNHASINHQQSLERHTRNTSKLLNGFKCRSKSKDRTSRSESRNVDEMRLQFQIFDINIVRREGMDNVRNDKKI